MHKWDSVRQSGGLGRWLSNRTISRIKSQKVFGNCGPCAGGDDEEGTVVPGEITVAALTGMGHWERICFIVFVSFYLL